jgi:flagellar basal body rod protein FlgC
MDAASREALQESIMDPISTASSGLLAAGARFDSASLNVVRAAGSGGSGDLTSAIVDQTTAGQSFQASAAVLKTSNQMLNALLDITV